MMPTGSDHHDSGDGAPTSEFPSPLCLKVELEGTGWHETNQVISRRGSTEAGSKIWPRETLQNPSNPLKTGVMRLTSQG